MSIIRSLYKKGRDRKQKVFSSIYLIELTLPREKKKKKKKREETRTGSTFLGSFCFPYIYIDMFFFFFPSFLACVFPCCYPGIEDRGWQANTLLSKVSMSLSTHGWANFISATIYALIFLAIYSSLIFFLVFNASFYFNKKALEKTP